MGARIFIGSRSYPPEAPGPVVSMGNFDGLHRGHREVLAALLARARALGRPALVYTFEPLPREVLGRGGPRILALEDRVRLLAGLGVDAVCVEPFSRAFARHPASWFAREVLGRRLRAAALVVGHDFRFGAGREGGVEQVRAALPGLSVEQVGPVLEGGSPVSSTRIRALLAQGRVAQAAELLGRPHFVRGTVVRGAGRGRRIGVPTANLLLASGQLPAPGVYAVRARVDGGPLLPAVANLGWHPTFPERGGPWLEVHLLVEPPGELLGRELEVAFVDWLRPEQRFPGPQALLERIRLDVEEARRRLKAGD